MHRQTKANQAIVRGKNKKKGHLDGYYSAYFPMATYENPTVHWQWSNFYLSLL